MVVVDIDVVPQDIAAPRQVPPDMVCTAVPAAQQHTLHEIILNNVLVALMEKRVRAYVVNPIVCNQRPDTHGGDWLNVIHRPVPGVGDFAVEEAVVARSESGAVATFE